MGVTGLLTLLSMLFVSVKLVTCAPYKPVCDKTVVDMFIKEAREAETAMDSCNIICQFPEDIMVPETKLNLGEWNKLHVCISIPQAAEVWNGLILFTKAVPRIADFISDASLKFQVEKIHGDVRSAVHLFKSLNLQDEVQTSQSEAKTLPVRTFKKFFSVYTNFLRGKLRLLVMAVCHEASLFT
ncbi:erythropoietin precursor [Xenopus tropicalis]|uniref:Erythropoietin n=2 Tax=Xenopus tropicalis TaxID=8364 RepID=G0T3F6_XENTR|nr:erythropoietin precursor [Xenopus tropicalis]ADJ68000.1 erythropoietin [Xenopus tropicalis]|eukprot:NP_001233194.1 erythropoietin precursor [Xenopus tropicalis]